MAISPTTGKVARLSIGMLIAGTLVGLGVPATDSSVQPLAYTSAVAPDLKGVGSCPDIDYVFLERSQFPATDRGTVNYVLQHSRIRTAVLCLVNAERTAANLPQLKTFVEVGKPPRGLNHAARSHAEASASLRWWGKVQPGKTCRPVQDRPDLCDPHINPQTGSTPFSRVQGDFRSCAGAIVRENAYAGWGTGGATSRAAVGWWMISPSHRATILDPQMQITGIGVASGSADPDAGSITPAVTFVEDFCS